MSDKPLPPLDAAIENLLRIVGETIATTTEQNEFLERVFQPSFLDLAWVMATGSQPPAPTHAAPELKQ